jgi:hypothetical protein
VVGEELVPVGLDAETFHTTLHLLSIVLLVYVVRHVTRDTAATQARESAQEQLDRVEMKLSVLASNVAWTDNPRKLQDIPPP